VFWKRALTAAILVPVTVAVVLLAPLWLLSGLVGVVTLLALWEFFRLGDLAGFTGFVQWTTLCSLLIVYVQWTSAGTPIRRLTGGFTLIRPATIPGGIEGILVLFLVGLAVSVSFTKLEVSRRLPALIVSAGGLLLVALPLSYLVRVAEFPSGRRFLLLLLVLIWVGDTSAYFIGKGLGRVPMAPVLSPKKTWEGAAANLLGSLVVGLLAARWLPLPALSVLTLVLLANVAGQAGDLLESAYKRSASVKDSGQLLPGHGGMLDRIDSLALAAPIAWWYLTWLLTTGHLR
jgi:phosphatidate cytidylyltransferase